MTDDETRRQQTTVREQEYLRQQAIVRLQGALEWLRTYQLPLTTFPPPHVCTAVENAITLLAQPPTGTPAEPKTGAELIAAERARQVSAEGWTPEHDDEHRLHELLDASRSYINATINPKAYEGRPPAIWPWVRSWWRPSDDRVRNLVKAGALIAAEIDRLMRQSTAAAAGSCPPEPPTGREP